MISAQCESAAQVALDKLREPFSPPAVVDQCTEMREVSCLSLLRCVHFALPQSYVGLLPVDVNQSPNLIKLGSQVKPIKSIEVAPLKERLL